MVPTPTRTQWRNALASPAFPQQLRVLRGTLLALAPLMTTQGVLERPRVALEDAVGLPPRTLDRHLRRAVDTGWLRWDRAGGNGRAARYVASIPPSCPPKVADNYPKLSATHGGATRESCPPPGGDLLVVERAAPSSGLETPTAEKPRRLYAVPPY